MGVCPPDEGGSGGGVNLGLGISGAGVGEGTLGLGAGGGGAGVGLGAGDTPLTGRGGFAGFLVNSLTNSSMLAILGPCPESSAMSDVWLINLKSF